GLARDRAQQAHGLAFVVDRNPRWAGLRQRGIVARQAGEAGQDGQHADDGAAAAARDDQVEPSADAAECDRRPPRRVAQRAQGCACQPGSGDDQDDHGVAGASTVTMALMPSNVLAGTRPRSSTSSTVSNGPSTWRECTMRREYASPIPGSASN